MDCDDAFGWLEATNQRSRLFLCSVHTSEKEGVGTEELFYLNPIYISLQITVLVLLTDEIVLQIPNCWK